MQVLNNLNYNIKRLAKLIYNNNVTAFNPSTTVYNNIIYTVLTIIIIDLLYIEAASTEYDTYYRVEPNIEASVI